MMTTISSRIQDMTAQDAIAIPALNHTEAGTLARQEFEHLLGVVEMLDGDDWTQPTYCTAWNVRDMVAHLAGACASFASWDEFKHQMIHNPYAKTEAMQVDGINRLQIEDRAEMSTEELIAELREVGPKAIHTRQRLPWLLRKLVVPMGPPLGTTSVDYLTDVIYTRDWWMHRYDLCAATGQTMVLSDAHDGRMIALIVRDLARKLRKQLDGRTLDLVLTGVGGASYRFGHNNTPDATIEMDIITFGLLTSERISAEDARMRTTITGDHTAANWFFQNAAVPF
jgi:uncharacterized protein (TIGR03083 family)